MAMPTSGYKRATQRLVQQLLLRLHLWQRNLQLVRITTTTRMLEVATTVHPIWVPTTPVTTGAAAEDSKMSSGLSVWTSFGLWMMISGRPLEPVSTSLLPGTTLPRGMLSPWSDAVHSRHHRRVHSSREFLSVFADIIRCYLVEARRCS